MSYAPDDVQSTGSSPKIAVSRRAVVAGAAAMAGSLAIAPWSARATPRRRVISVANGSQTPYVIVVGTEEGPVVRHAASELADHLNQITGAEFPIVAPADVPTDRPVIALGRLNPWATNQRRLIAPDPLPAEDPERDGFALRAHLADLLIAGVSPRGTLYGVYWVLDRLLGVRWFAHDTTVIPQNAELTIDESEFSGDHHARFDYRELFTSDSRGQHAWRHRNLQNGLRGFGTSEDVAPGLDTWSRIWPGIHPGQFKEIITDRTLWHGGQVLFMDPRTRDAATTRLVQLIQNRLASEGDASNPFHINDGVYDNPDPVSAAFAAAHGGARSAPMLDMVNEVARRVKAEIPQARLETQAYHWALTPPTGMQVENNVVVTTAPIFADIGSSMFTGRNAVIGGHLHQWADMADELVMWDYHYSIKDFLSPLADWWSHAATIKQMAAMPHYVGYFAELLGSQGGWGFAFNPLRQWVMGRLLWDPELDTDELIEEFCDGYYGPAGAPIVAAMRALHQAREAAASPIPLDKETVGGHYLAWQVLRECDQLFEQAADAVQPDSLYGKHVQMPRMCIDHPILLRGAQLSADAAAAGVNWDVRMPARLARQEAALTASGATRLDLSNTTPQKMLEAYAVPRTARSALPAACVGLPDSDYRILEDAAIWQRYASTTLVFDELASDHGAVRLDGTKETWTVQLGLSQVPTEGTWRLYATVRAEIIAGADPSKTALAYGRYPTPAGSAEPSEWLLPVSDFDDGVYHEIEIDLDLQYLQDRAYIYFTGRNPAVTWLFFDRLYLVRKPS